ncbi:DUF3592 domain-containing protein [Micromonospora sp. SL1-18]|uniref:DUF3592 domain-containing protein n=1 Tax=Micromonospora sp. SL1-18 TaxID=3399128 RepID=UPI003A4DD931
MARRKRRRWRQELAATTRRTLTTRRELRSVNRRLPPRGPVQREPRSRWRPGYWLRHPVFAALLFGCGVLILVSCGVGGLVDQKHLRERGESTIAVVEVARQQRRGVWMTVRITTPRGEVVSARVIHPPGDLPAPGDRLTVVYDPEEPEYAYLPGDGQAAGSAVLIIALGVVPGVLYGWYLRRTWWRWRDQAENWRHRRPVRRLGVRQDPWPRRRA